MDRTSVTLKGNLTRRTPEQKRTLSRSSGPSVGRGSRGSSQLKVSLSEVSLSSTGVYRIFPSTS